VANATLHFVRPFDGLRANGGCSKQFTSFDHPLTLTLSREGRGDKAVRERGQNRAATKGMGAGLR
jgi:hypothetical protein